MVEAVVTIGAISRAKLQSNHHRQQTNTQFFTGQMPFLSPNQQCQSTDKCITCTTLILVLHRSLNSYGADVGKVDIHVGYSALKELINCSGRTSPVPQCS